jgi:hypothetical protein
MRIDAATPLDIEIVALNMRERDLEEFSAVYPVNTRFDLAGVLAERYGGRDDIIVARRDDLSPVAVGGALEFRPNVVSLFLFATPHFGEIVLPLTRFVKHRLLAPLVRAGAHRIEAVTLDSYKEMHRWLEILGLHREAQHPCYGKRGETFATYAWVKGR